MWTITLRDLQFRRRQFAIAIAGAALVFALTLILTGISAGFRTEARDITAAIDADAWVVPRGATGPFTAQSSIPDGVARAVARAPGVREAHGLVKFSYVARLPGGDVRNVNVIGHDAGRLGDPRWGAGPSPAPPGRAVVDERLGAREGDTLAVGTLRLRVDDVVERRTYLAGVPVVYVGLRDARALAYAGRPLSSTVLVRGAPRALPPGLVALGDAAVRKDLILPLDGATSVIDTLRLLMWIVAALIIGAVTYLSALERVRDFAVLKAVGGSSRALALSLTAQAVVASLGAALLGAGLAHVLRPAFPVPVTIEPAAYVALPFIAIVVGALASLAALRRAVRVDPALAFAG